MSKREGELPLTHRAVQIGQAGEYLVAADLLLRGHNVSLGGVGLQYDILLDILGRFYRLNVKATLSPKGRPGRPGSSGRYGFSIRRTGRRANGVSFSNPYLPGSIDIVALVALDTKRVGYLALAECPASIWLHAEHGAARTNTGPARSDGVRTFAELSLERALECVG